MGHESFPVTEHTLMAQPCTPSISSFDSSVYDMIPHFTVMACTHITNCDNQLFLIKAFKFYVSLITSQIKHHQNK